MSNEAVNKAAKRVLELETAKAKLERQAAINKAEIAKAYATGKEEGRQSVVDRILPVLPQTTFSSQSTAYRVLAKDINTIIENIKKGKKK